MILFYPCCLGSAHPVFRLAMKAAYGKRWDACRERIPDFDDGKQARVATSCAGGNAECHQIRQSGSSPVQMLNDAFGGQIGFLSLNRSHL